MQELIFYLRLQPYILPVCFLDGTLPKSNKEFAFYELPFKLDVFDQEKFKESKIEFHVVMTNVENGQAEYVLIEDVFEQMEYLRATSALPFASKIIEINGKKYLDGGISDSIPIDYCQSLGLDTTLKACNSLRLAICPLTCSPGMSLTARAKGWPARSRCRMAVFVLAPEKLCSALSTR